MGILRLRTRRCMGRRTRPGRRVHAGGLCDFPAANSFAPAGGRQVTGSKLKAHHPHLQADRSLPVHILPALKHGGSSSTFRAYRAVRDPHGARGPRSTRCAEGRRMANPGVQDSGGRWGSRHRRPMLAGVEVREEDLESTPGLHVGDGGDPRGGGRGAAAGALPVRQLLDGPAAGRGGRGAAGGRHHPPDRVLGAAVGGRRARRHDDQVAPRPAGHPHPGRAADVHDAPDGDRQRRAARGGRPVGHRRADDPA